MILQYYIYLFERILLCCKEMGVGKKQNKTMSMGKNTKPGPGMKKRSSLQLKGRIFMQNVTDVVSIARNGTYQPSIASKSFARVFFADAMNQKKTKKNHQVPILCRYSGKAIRELKIS